MGYEDTLTHDTWLDCIKKLGGTPDDLLFTALSRLYADRPYHNFDHIDYCLRFFHTIDWDERDAVGLAIVYHDAIQYTGVRGLNETLSGEVARSHCNHMGIYGKSVDTITRCIAATKHENPAFTHDSKLVADIDLAILSAEKGDYEFYARAIRDEYISKSFESGRKDFLKHMLTRKIYQSDEFAYREERARDNMFEELSMYSPRVAVGGTFDLLHEGHKALLTEAFRMAGPYGGKVFIGLTTDTMASKTHEVQPYDTRRRQIEKWYSPGEREYFIEPLNDAFGPTLEEDFDVLVASEETRKGAEEVNARRIKMGKKPIPLRIIPVVMEDGERISSTSIRARGGRK